MRSARTPQIVALLITLLVLAVSAPALAETPSKPASAAAQSSPIAPDQRLITFDFKETDIHDVLRVLGAQRGVTIVPDPSVAGKVTIHVDGVEFEEGLRVLTSTHGYAFAREGSVYRVFKPKAQLFRVGFDKARGLLSVQATGADLGEVIREVAAQTGMSVVVDRSVRQAVTVNLADLAPEPTLEAIADASGLSLVKKDGYFLLGPGEAPPGPGIELMQIEDGRITARVKDTDLGVFVRELSNRARLNLIADREARGTVSGTLTGAPLMSGLGTFFEANGLSLVERNGAWLVRKAAPTSFTVTRRDDGRYDLAVNGADLVQVLRELADRAKVNLVIYQYVRSQANNVNVTGVTLDEAFEYLLRGTNFTLRRDGDIYIIGDGSTPRPEALEFMETRFIRLQYVMAETIPAALPPSIPSSLIKIVKDQNAVLVTATPEVADRVGRYLAMLDVPGREIVAEVVRPKYARVEEILPLLARYFPPQTFQQLKDLSGVIVSGTPETVGQVKAFIDKMDLPSPVRNELLSLKNVKAEDVPRLLPSNFDKNSLLVLAQQNAVVVTGSEAYIQELRRYLAAVDIPNPQILFDVVVVEYQRDSSLAAGLSLSGRENATTYGLNSPNDEGNPTGLTVNVDSTKNLSVSFSATLNALVQKGRAKVLANPKLATLNGESATFNVVSKAYYWDPLYDDTAHQSTTTGGSGGTGGTPGITSDLPTLRGGSPRSIDTGIKLRLKPWVSGSGDITIDIEPSISDSVGSQADLPRTNERSARTTVRVRDGQTVIIGGLIQTERHEGSYRVPLLSSIPVLGQLFRSRNDLDKQIEFVIYITPYLVQEGAGIASRFTPVWRPEEIQTEGAALPDAKPTE